MTGSILPSGSAHPLPPTGRPTRPVNGHLWGVLFLGVALALALAAVVGVGRRETVFAQQPARRLLGPPCPGCDSCWLCGGSGSVPVYSAGPRPVIIGWRYCPQCDGYGESRE